MIESGPMAYRCKKQSKRYLVVLSGIIAWVAACTPGASQPAQVPLAVLESPIVEPTSSTVDLEQLAPELNLGETELADGQTEGSTGAINPLTGLIVQDRERLGRRPILVKVTLYPRNNRPQWGLSFADIVYEHYTEGGLSRFAALFYSKEAEVVGPIRSARLVDIQLVRMYGALFAYGSADSRVLEQIDNAEFAERAVREFPAGCPPLCRMDPTGQNHLVTDTQALQAFYENQGVDLTAPDLRGMIFEALPPESTLTGQRIWTSYSTDNFHEWLYDAGVGLYHRSQESGAGSVELIPLTDRTTGQLLESANIVYLEVPHPLYARTPEIVDIQLYGEGDGLAFRDGQAYAVRWIRPFPEGVLYLTFPDGSPYPFKPGTTWFELIGISSQIEQGEDEAWKITFEAP